MTRSQLLRMDNIGVVVESLDFAIARLRQHGAQLVGEVVQYEQSYRLCYVRGPEGLLIGLVQALGVSVGPGAHSGPPRVHLIPSLAGTKVSPAPFASEG